ncbi:MAG TPA: Gfo/Idh/MocA family oxidoreductase [Micromonosporaceae bacterium]|nr:Gfo/Idh/MocA family oxidoreductase [Micromonosporaceae bacterium]
MRLGVVGCGYWGSKHLRVLQQIPAVHQVVVVDPRPERRAELAGSVERVTAFADLESALPHVDGVVIAAPPKDHAPLAMQAIAAGKHVLVEKPMTTSTATARQLIQEAAARDVTLMVGHTFEYNAAVWKLREVIESGELGDIYYIDTARLNLGIYQADCNVIWDLAPHDISIVNYLLRRNATWTQAFASRYANYSQEDVGYLRLGYEAPSVRAQIHVSWLDPCKVRRVTVVGSQKMAVYNDMADQERLRIYDKGLETPPSDDVRNRPMTYRHGGISLPYIEMREPLRVQDEHFVECIATGRRPRTDGESGLAVVHVLEAAAQSMQLGSPIRIPDRDVLHGRSGPQLPLGSTDLVRRGG